MLWDCHPNRCVSFTRQLAAHLEDAQPLGDGRYQVKGEFFSMLGEWEFDVKITKGGQEEVARFKVPVNEA